MLRELGSGLSRVTERWVPDSWVICMILTTIALLLAIGGAGASVREAVLACMGRGALTGREDHHE